MKKPAIEQFQRLADMGFSLIPLNGKIPFEPNWQRYCETKREFNKTDFKNHNAGVACGPASGVIVGDVDHLKSFEALAAANGWKVPDTLTVRSSEKKRHLYFKYPQNGSQYGNRSIKHPLNPKQTVFDIKGNGGQVVAPGSIHPDTGQLYRIINDVEIAEAPQWIIDLAQGADVDVSILEETKDEKILVIDTPNTITDPYAHPSELWIPQNYGMPAADPKHVSPAKDTTASPDPMPLPEPMPPTDTTVSAEPTTTDGDDLISSLDVSDQIKELIIEGKPQGERSEAIMSTLKALLGAGIAEPTIFNIFDTYPIGAKYRDKGNTKDRWLKAEINRALAHNKNTEKKFYKWTDSGNGERFADQHRGSVHYNHLQRLFYIWNGKRWKPDDCGQIMLLAKQTARSIDADVAKIDDDDKRKKAREWAHSCESQYRKKAMIASAQSEPGIPIATNQLDINPWLYNVQNGTLNLQTGQLQPHNRADLITKISPVTFDPAAACPLWHGFLDKIFAGDQEIIDFIQRAVGYSLTGATFEQCFFFLWGKGANGKSTMLETLNFVLGDFGQVADFLSFTAGRQSSIRNDIARMVGARLVIATETGDGTRFDEPVLKQITGGDTVTCRFMYKEFFEFVPQFKIWLAANYKPSIEGQDHAMWRRLKCIPFLVTIPPHEQDPRLTDKLKAEAPGILNWALSGCLEWQREGLKVPDTVLHATKEYRTEVDILNDFITSRCVFKPHAKVWFDELYRAYESWCSDTHEIPISKKEFKRRVINHNCVITRSTGGKYLTKGMGLRYEA